LEAGLSAPTFEATGDVDGGGSCALNEINVEAHNATVKLRRGVFTMKGSLADEMRFYPPFSIKSVFSEWLRQWGKIPLASRCFAPTPKDTINNGDQKPLDYIDRRQS
jgi:hypothetical protein